MMQRKLADKLLMNDIEIFAFFAGREEANSDSQTSHGAPTPSPSHLSNDTSLPSEPLGGEPTQQHGSAWFQLAGHRPSTSRSPSPSPSPH